MIFAAIAAGGSGSRMGAAVPKQYIELCGKPMIVRTIEAFSACELIDEIYVGTDADGVEKINALCEKFKISNKPIYAVRGGTDRNSTVFAMVNEIISKHGINENDIILTHDGARPFVTQKIIKDNIKAMEHADAAATAVGSVDTLFFSTADVKFIESVPPRTRMLRAQTPQTFKLKKLNEAYASLSENQKAGLTDTAGIFSLCSIPIALVAGDEKNIKITTPFDLKLAKLIIEETDAH